MSRSSPGRQPGHHRVRDIAEQAGLSEATVDRVLHRRPGVSARAVRQVEQALLELDRQASQLRLGARSLLLDVVMQAPARFTRAVREGLETELGGFRPAAVRARFELWEQGEPAETVARLDRVGRGGRRSHGVLLKAPDHPEVVAAVDRVVERGIPVVTLVTDLPGSGRLGYVGLDNRAAGRTAAYLVDRWARDVPGSVLVTTSRRSFVGEQERREAFEEALLGGRAARDVVAVTDADGLDASMRAALAEALSERPDVVAVYSIGGGNRAILGALDERGLRPRLFLGHDLDDDNLELLRTGRLDAVLHHDLRADMAAAVRQVLRAHRLLPGAPRSVWTRPQLVTPHNIPFRFTPD